MITFKEFLKESIQKISTIANFDRKSMKRFVDIPNDIFLAFIDKIRSNNNFIPRDSEFFSKLDGFPITFGKDSSGKFFMASSKSGPQFGPNFLKYTEKKTIDKKRIERSKHYDQLFSLLENLDVIKKLPNNTKIYSEIMFRPMSEETDKGIKFVSVVYDKNKLGKLLTIFPYSVLESDSNNRSSDYREILNSLYKYSNQDIKFIDPKLKISDKGISVAEALANFKNENSQDEINTYKNKIADILLRTKNLEGKYKIGSNIEGIVIWISGTPYKITTDKYKNDHEQEFNKGN